MASQILLTVSFSHDRFPVYCSPSSHRLNELKWIGWTIGLAALQYRSRSLRTFLRNLRQRFAHILSFQYTPVAKFQTSFRYIDDRADHEYSNPYPKSRYLLSRSHCLSECQLMKQTTQGHAYLRLNTTTSMPVHDV